MPLALLLLAALTLAAQFPGKYTIVKSTDQGRTWTRSGNGLPGTTRINAFGATATAQFAGTDTGIFITRDQAKTWRQVTTAVRVISFATQGQSIFAGTASHGLLQSADNGNTWSPNPLPAKNIRSLLAHAGKLYAGTDKDGVFVYNGAAWTPLKQGLPAMSQIFALASSGDQIFAALYAKGIYKWVEQQQRWERSGEIAPLALASSGDILLAGHNPGSIFRSGDVGTNWSPINQQEIKPIWELAANTQTALAGAATGIYVSADQGRTWMQTHNSPGVAFLAARDFMLAGTIANVSH